MKTTPIHHPKTTPNSYAFARPHSEYRDGDVGEDYSDQNGLTKREYFAAKFYAAMITSPGWGFDGMQQGASEAVQHADALIEQLNQPPGRAAAQE